jgi:hypothetical protein
MKSKLKLFNGMIILSMLLLHSCNDSDKQKKSNESNNLKNSLNVSQIENNITASSKKNIYTLNDLILFSRNNYGFLNSDGTINEFYGDIDFVSVEKNLFDFNIGCGHSGDIISVILSISDSKNNFFNIYIPKGDRYFGKPADSNVKIGELEVISENEIHGQIKLCLEEGSGCCGEIGENFIMKKISKNPNASSKKEKGFTIKKYKNLPIWFAQTDISYMLNDDRILESELVEYIGGHVPNSGEIFFINNIEVLFPENKIKVEKAKSVITKFLKSGKYTIKIIWDTSLTTGAYSSGTIDLYYENEPIFNSSLIISGY